MPMGQKAVPNILPNLQWLCSHMTNAAICAKLKIPHNGQRDRIPYWSLSWRGYLTMILLQHMNPLKMIVPMQIVVKTMTISNMGAPQSGCKCPDPNRALPSDDMPHKVYMQWTWHDSQCAASAHATQLPKTQTYTSWDAWNALSTAVAVMSFTNDIPPKPS